MSNAIYEYHVALAAVRKDTVLSLAKWCSIPSNGKLKMALCFKLVPVSKMSIYDHGHALTSGPASVTAFIDETATVSEGYQVVTDDTLHHELTQSPITPVRRSTLPSTPKLPGSPLINERDAFYMSRYVEYHGPWFDLFDNTDRHFSTIVPQLALSNNLILYACLASAARQYSLVNDVGREDALEYYDIALRTLHDHLETQGHEPATFASCLLIAHCEMIESHASDWNLHLQGTRSLVAAQGWNTGSKGLAQAVCWGHNMRSS